MKNKFFACLLVGILSVSSSALAAKDPKASTSEADKMQVAREQIAQDAAFIRKVDSDSKMTPDQKKSAIAEFLRKQNEKLQ